MNYYNYFTEIEETFVRRRGKNLMLSPLDWALIESWQEREVPLHIILRGIERVFDTIDKQPHRRRSVKSLFYCKEEIEAQFAEWLETQVGASASDKNGEARSEPDAEAARGELFSRQAIDEHLRGVSAELAAAAARAESPETRETFARVLSRLTEMGANYESAEKLEETLEKLDALVDEALLETLPVEELRKTVEKQIASYKNKMETEVFNRTRDLMIVKKLREQAGVPRLSLFYL